MENFKTYFSDDGKSFSAETKILFGQCGSNKRIHLTEVMEYCADNVMEMYNQKGQSRQVMADHGYVQMVSRSSFHINRLPYENEIITVTVREEKPEGFQLMRYYDFKTQTGEMLILGKSLWVIVTPDTREIVKPEDFECLIKSDLQTEFEKNPGKIKTKVELQHLGDQKILLSHLDPNGHLTNAKYINFAIDYLPQKFQEKEITDFRLNFCKEMKKDEIMHIYGFFDEENKRIVVVGKRTLPEDPEKSESSFECEIFYK